TPDAYATGTGVQLAAAQPEGTLSPEDPTCPAVRCSAWFGRLLVDQDNLPNGAAFPQELLAEGGSLKREPAVDDGLECAPPEEVKQRGQVLAKPVRLSALQHLNAVDQQPLASGQQALDVRRRPPRRRREQPLEITFVTRKAGL